MPATDPLDFAKGLVPATDPLATGREPASAAAPRRPATVPRHAGLSLEAELLLRVVSPMDRTGQLRLRVLVDQDLQWDYVLEAAAYNEILPQLYWHLKSTCPERVPPSVLGQLQRIFCETSVRNLSLTRELVHLLETFRRHGIDAIPFKGPSLAQSLYRNVALRRTIDLDVLVRRNDVVRVAQLIAGEGYRPVPEMSAAQQAAHVESHYHFAFHRDDADVHVEIHWGILPKHCGFQDASYIWDHVTHERLAGQPILALPPEELFVLLSVHHGAKHEWDRLKWIADIGLMIETHRGMDWSRVLGRARSLGQQRAVLMGCYLAETLLGVRPPDEVLGLLKGDRSLPARAALIRGRLFRPGHGLPGFCEWHAYIGTEEGGWFSPFPYLRYLSAVMAPEFSDRYQLRFPAYFSFAHYLYRPIRLFTERGASLFNRLQ